MSPFLLGMVVKTLFLDGRKTTLLSIHIESQDTKK